MRADRSGRPGTDARAIDHARGPAAVPTAAFDPATPLAELVRLAHRHPELRSILAEHPGADQALRDWITAHPGPRPPRPAPPPARTAPGADRPRGPWRTVLVIIAILAALALITWYVIDARRTLEASPTAPTPTRPQVPSTTPLPTTTATTVTYAPTRVLPQGDWSAPIPVPDGATRVWPGGPDRLAVTSDSTATIEYVNAVTLQPVMTHGTEAPGGYVFTAAGQPRVGADGRATTVFAYGPSTGGYYGRWWLHVDEDHGDGSAFASPSLNLQGGVRALVWAGATPASPLIVADEVWSTALSFDASAGHGQGDVVWTAGAPLSWVGSEAFGTSSGMINAVDGSRASYGQDTVGSPAGDAYAIFYAGPDGHPLRIQRYYDCRYEVRAWDARTDQPTWTQPVAFDGRPGWVWDEARGEYLFLVLSGVGPTPSCRSTPDAASLTAYSMADGTPLWTTPLGLDNPALCQFQNTRQPWLTGAADAVGGYAVIGCEPVPPSGGWPGTTTQWFSLASGTHRMALAGRAAGVSSADVEYIIGGDETVGFSVHAYDARAVTESQTLGNAPYLFFVTIPEATPGLPVLGDGLPPGVFWAGDWLTVLTPEGLRILR